MKWLLAALVLTVAGVRSASAQSIAGEWDASMETPGATVTFKLIFKQTKDSLTGTVKRASGDVPLVGSIKKDSVSFQYTILYNENPLLMKLRGRVVGDSLSGVVDFGGGNEAGFSGHRAVVKPEAAAMPARTSGGGGGYR